MSRPAVCVAALLAAFALQAQEPAPTPSPSTPPNGAPPAAAAMAGMMRSQEPEIKPYEKVITKEAKTDEGLFRIHRIKSKVYYEIPKNLLGKDLLWVSQIAKTTLGVGYGGQAAGNRVVRWERHGDRVLLRSVDYDVVADPKLPIAKAVEAANHHSILMAFNIEALGKGEAPVIEVTRLFTTEVSELSARSRLRARGFDPTRSFIERVKSFPENVEVEVTQTYTAPPEMPGMTPSPTPLPSFFGAGMRGNTATVVMHYSMIKLPEQPMMPRLFDERVGYFSVRQMDYGVDEHRAPRRTYITRWRLDKKDPSAEMSEPVKPIVFYIDPATPTKLVPYIKKGIEAWVPAFEAAGFRNAIMAKDAPAGDPEWSAEDARYSVIRWLPSTIENAMGPHVHDPRTGEILEADIQMYHNIMNLQRAWYFTQAGPLDKRAQKLPLPDDLMGELVEYVVAHEVGHSLGFQHNMKASSMYPAEKVRDKEWVRTMGHTPTLMDYSRFNYVAQPEDGIDPKHLIPRIGPYDKWATMWGYKPIPSATTPDQEKATLNEWSKDQDEKPYLRFNTAKAFGADPGEQTEAVGDADAIASTALGVKNLQRVFEMLIPATTGKQGETYDDLEELYGRALGQWTLEMNHVANIVGGFQSQQKHVGQAGVRFNMVPRERQAAAVAFLNRNAFQTPAYALSSEILRRIEPQGTLSRVRNAQRRVLDNLLSPARFGRLVEQEAIDGPKAYKPLEFLADLRKGVFSELAAPSPKADPYRRNLHRTYLETMGDKLVGRFPFSDDQRPFVRGELKTLSQELAAALPRTSDRATRLHMEDLRDQIAKILDPKFAPPAAPSALLMMGRPGLDGTPIEEGFENGLQCWPDYSIRP